MKNLKSNSTRLYLIGAGIFLALVVVVSTVVVNFTSANQLPELTRTQIERYAVCSFWFFGWHLASTGLSVLIAVVIGFTVGWFLAFKQKARNLS